MKDPFVLQLNLMKSKSNTVFFFLQCTKPHVPLKRLKLKLFLCFNRAPRHEGVWGSGDKPQRILDLDTDGGEWSVSRTGRFTPREKARRTHWIGGWVSPRAGLDAVVERKFPARVGTRTPDHPDHSTALYRLSFRIPHECVFSTYTQG
jgi:hypothetical protein